MVEGKMVGSWARGGNRRRLDGMEEVGATSAASSESRRGCGQLGIRTEDERGTHEVEQVGLPLRLRVLLSAKARNQQLLEEMSGSSTHLVVARPLAPGVHQPEAVVQVRDVLCVEIRRKDRIGSVGFGRVRCPACAI